MSRREHRGLRAEGLCKQFPGQVVLESADLDVPQGCLAVLKGRNGVGKTTLLRIFATVLRPDAGEAWVDGATVTTDGARVRDSIGVAFVNERSLYWRMSVWHNLRFFARTGHVPRREEASRISGLLDELGLTGVADRWVANLSAGQRQRLVLARAALREPSVLLLDEPMRGLDEDGVDRVRSFLLRRSERGTTTLVVAPTLTEFDGLPALWLQLEGGKVTDLYEHSRGRPK